MLKESNMEKIFRKVMYPQGQVYSATGCSYIQRCGEKHNINSNNNGDFE